MTQSARLESLGREPSHPPSLSAALAEWLMVLPAAFFLAAGALRLLQPRRFKPARACWIIFEWTRTHVTHLQAAVIFPGLPTLALIVGSGALWRGWRRNPALRQDAAHALAILRRQLGTVSLAAAVLLASGILTFVVGHLIVG